MRYAVIVALLVVAPLSAQGVNIPADAVWVGPLQFRDSRGELIVPTRVRLKIANGKVTGDWTGLIRTPPAPGGLIEGTIDDKSRLRLTVSLFGGADNRDVNGNVTTTESERCAAEAKFEGFISSSGVFRWQASKAEFNTDRSRARGRECENIDRLVWYLQVDQH